MPMRIALCTDDHGALLDLRIGQVKTQCAETDSLRVDEIETGSCVCRKTMFASRSEARC